MDKLVRLISLLSVGLTLAYGTWDAASETPIPTKSDNLSLALLALTIYGVGVLFGHIDAKAAGLRKKLEGK